MAQSKQYTDNTKKYDRDHLHSDAEAVAILKSLGTKQFDETIDIVVRLGVDPRKADQMIRATVALPSGTGKDVRIAVFAQGVAVFVLVAVAAETVEFFQSEGQWFELRVAAATRFGLDAVDCDRALGDAGFGWDGRGVCAGGGIFDDAAQQVVEDEKAAGDHGCAIATDRQDAALREEAAAVAKKAGRKGGSFLRQRPAFGMPMSLLCELCHDLDESHTYRNWSYIMTIPTRIKSLLIITSLLFVISLLSCSTINTIPPEVNLMKVDVQDVTLSHVNLLADLRVFNPNSNAVTIQGVDYTLHLEGIKVFSGKSNMTQTIKPQEYGFLTLRLSSSYWDIIQLLNKVPDKTDAAFSMQGSILVGESNMFAKRFSFNKEGVIPLQKTNLRPDPNR